MFYSCCGDCGNRWLIGDARTCVCPEEDTWVGLTDVEIEAAWHKSCTMDNGTHAVLTNQPFYHLCKLIEAILKEKNAGK
jgi:hypothetical protein